MDTFCVCFLSFIVKIVVNERKSEQAHIPHTTTLLENAVYNEWQFQALVMGNPVLSELHKMNLAKVQKRYKLLLKKDQISIPVKIKSFITTKKFCWAVSVELCWRTVLSSIFNFGQISMFKKGYYS